MDIYKSVSLHGMLPLMKDEVGGRLRFAVLGVDRPEDCIMDADALPDAEISIHAFADSGQMKAWVAGVRQIADNSVQIETSPYIHIPCALLVRHDRPGRTGDLEDVVPLVVVGSSRTDAAWARVTEERQEAVRQARAALRAAWAVEIAKVIDLDGAVSDMDAADDPGALRFELRHSNGMMGMGPSFRAVRSSVGFSVSWPLKQAIVDAVGAQFHLETNQRGLRYKDGCIHAAIETFDKAALDFLREAHEWSENVEKGVRDAEKAGRVVEALLADGHLNPILRRAVSGSPIVVGSRGEQFDINKRRPVWVTDGNLTRLLRDGLVSHAWAGEVSGEKLSIYLETELGKALVEKDREFLESRIISARTNENLVEPLARGGDFAASIPALDAVPKAQAKALEAARANTEFELKHSDTPGLSSMAVVAAMVRSGVPAPILELSRFQPKPA